MHCSQKRHTGGIIAAVGLALVLIVLLGLYLYRPTAGDGALQCVTLAEAKTTQDYQEFQDNSGLTCPAAPTQGWCPPGHVPQWTYYPGGQPSGGSCNYTCSGTDSSSLDVQCAENAIQCLQRPDQKVAVIYLEYTPIGVNSTYADFCKSIRDAANSGYNVLILAFVELDTVTDSARMWTSLPKTSQAQIMNALHQKGIVMTAAYGGASPFLTGAPTVDQAKKLAQWALDNHLDGIDFDVEGINGNVYNAQSLAGDIDNLGKASQAVKELYASNSRSCIVTHAPQGPYFTADVVNETTTPSFMGTKASYTDLVKEGGKYAQYIDWLNVQFYNQSGAYAQADTLINKAEMTKGARGTAVRQILKGGIPGHKIVIGKCASAASSCPVATPPNGLIACASACGEDTIMSPETVQQALNMLQPDEYKGFMLWRWEGTNAPEYIKLVKTPLGLTPPQVNFTCPTGKWPCDDQCPDGPSPTTGPSPTGPTVPPATCDDGCSSGCLMPKPPDAGAKNCVWYSGNCKLVVDSATRRGYCTSCDNAGTSPCPNCSSSSGSGGEMICQAWSCDMDTAEACTQKGGTVCGNNPTPCPGGDGLCYEVPPGSTNDGRHKIFPTQRKVPEKVLWGYWCQNTMTGAVCSGILPSPGKTVTKDGTLLPTSKESIALLIDSGINLLTMFCNIWQPKVGWSNSGTVYGSEGYPTGSWSTSYGTENNGGNPNTGTGANPFGDSPNQKCGAAHVKALQQAGVSVLLTIGSWDAIFPRDGNTGYATKMPGRWTDQDVQDFVDTLDSMAVALGPGDGGKIDGFDFDLEGFGAGPVASKEGYWGEWCTQFAGRDGGPYPNETQLGVTGVNDSTGPTPGWSPDKQASATFTNINNPSDTQTYKWSDYADDYKTFLGVDPPNATQSKKGYTRGCYSFPDAGTIDTFNRVFQELKRRQYIVTVVPMSTGLYANTPKPSVMDPIKQPQNQFVVHGLDHSSVDGIMLQWYSGAGLDICPDGSGGFKQCNDDLDNQCDTSDKNDTNKNRQVALKDALDTLSKSELAKTSFWPKEDSIIIDVPLASTINATNKCPYKCPRKIDCPDWAYTGETPFASQVKVLKSIRDWLGNDFSKKLVVGLEAFPNFTGTISMASGEVKTNTQFWGPVPSAQALIGLDDALKGSKGKAKLLQEVVDENGLAGLGVYTANTAFVGTENCTDTGCQKAAMQYGLNKSIYHLLKKWKTESLQ